MKSPATKKSAAPKPASLAGTLAQLEALGSAQNRKVYARHGVTGAAFGVSFAQLGKLQRELGVNHELALGLWASGNHDARILACMLADAERLSVADLESWCKELDNYVLTEALARVAARCPHARTLVGKWTAARDEWRSTAGWNVLAQMLHAQAEFPDEDLARLLASIEKNIAKSPNRTRYAMNGALIAIGVASDGLRAETLATARRIGPVEVDHGQTGCKTPEATAYIQKVLEHRAGRGARARTAKPKATRKAAPRKTKTARQG